MNELIISTLDSIGIPINFETYEGKESTYITFSNYLSKGEGFADDGESATGHYYQIDIWSKRNYTELVTEVKKRLKAIGFTRVDERGFYERDTKIFHKALRFHFLEENKAEK